MPSKGDANQGLVARGSYKNFDQSTGELILWVFLGLFVLASFFVVAQKYIELFNANSWTNSSPSTGYGMATPDSFLSTEEGMDSAGVSNHAIEHNFSDDHAVMDSTNDTTFNGAEPRSQGFSPVNTIKRTRLIRKIPKANVVIGNTKESELNRRRRIAGVHQVDGATRGQESEYETEYLKD